MSHQNIAVTPKVTARDAVAVIGVGAVLPGALDAKQFWSNVLAGEYSIREVPPSRWSVGDYYDPDPKAPDKTYCKIGAFVEGFVFDSIRFKIPPMVAAAMDTVQQWAIVASREALMDAGLLDKDFNRDKTAVIFGNAQLEESINQTNLRVNLPIYLKALKRREDFLSLPKEKRESILEGITEEIRKISPAITEDTMPGELSNVISGRVANIFNLRGANFTTDAACASSLAALDAAVKGLRRGDYDLAIAGGVDRSMSPAIYIKFCKIGALSGEGSYPFDERASGFVMGEGCACFVLKRFGDALHDGDRVYAVITGIGTSSDGRGKGITAPNIEGQILALRRAYESSGVDPLSVDLVEAHGTATKVGDMVEAQALARLMEGRDRRDPVRVTSIKSQIGHLKAASGAASLLKTALALHHKVYPASINFDRPNPDIDWQKGAVMVQSNSAAWERSSSRPRRAGVSSFGFGGTNFHVTMQEAELTGTPVGRSGRRVFMKVTGPGAADEPCEEPDPSYYGVALGLVDEEISMSGAVGLIKGGWEITEGRKMTDQNIAGDILDRVRFMKAASLEELAAALISGKKPSRLSSLEEAAALKQSGWRLAIAGADEEALEEKLGRLLDAVGKGLDRKKISFIRRQGIYISDRVLSGIGFLYPGQGSQSINMLGELRGRYALFRDVLDEADRVMEPLLGRVLSSLVYTQAAEGSPERERMEERLRQTEVTQPAMLAMDHAMTRLLGEIGIAADFVTGHSLGEYSALVSAGVLRFQDALEIVAARGREMTSVSIDDPGMMFAAMADPETTAMLLAKVGGYLVPANKNSPKQTVVAGGTEAVRKAMDVFEAEGIRTVPLRVSHAFHSRIVAGAVGPLKKVLGRYEFGRPRVPVFANVTGEAYPMDAGRESFIDVLGRQIASPVEFIKCLSGMHGAGARFFVEVGPRKVLASFAEDVLPKEDTAIACANNHRQGDLESLACLFAAAAVEGVIRPGGTGAPAGSARAGNGGAGGASGHAGGHSAGPAQVGGDVKMTADTKQILSEILEIISGKTGYPIDMLDPAMDMEADLGIDTVKQAELFSLIRRRYDIPKQENLKLKDYPTIRRVADFVMKFVPAPADPAPVRAGAGAEAGGPQAGKPSADAAPRPPEAAHAASGVEPAPHHAAAGVPPPAQAILISGSAIGLPGRDRPLFGDGNFDDIFEGKNFIESIEGPLQERFLDLNIVRIDKGTGEEFDEKSVESVSDVIKLAGQMGRLDVVSDYGIDRDFAGSMDDTARMAAAAGLEALRDAGIPLVREMRKTTTGAEIPVGWHLPEAMRDDTGVVFGSAFPGYNRFAQELERHSRHKHLGEPYEFDRKLLFGILAMGHTQLAQLIKARGPNVHVNAACASGLLAMAIAVDWIRCGRCRRVLIVSADNTTSPGLLPWIGGGFLSNGGAATDEEVKEAAIPFDRRRHGLVLGMGAAALVVEAEDEVRARGMAGLARIIDTAVCNSAFHGSRLDVDHIAGVVEKFVGRCCAALGCTPGELAEGLVFLSHETYTPARGGSATAEVAGIRRAFGEHVSKIVVTNTKGFTGHPLGVGIEESVAPRILFDGLVPPVANISQVDPEFADLRLSRGGACEATRILRFAAGFGSQVGMALLERDGADRARIADRALYEAWLEAMAGVKKAVLFHDGRVLKVKPEEKRQDAGGAGAREAGGEDEAGIRIDAGEVRREVIALISEKTGYPSDMLDPDMDMEADLGIDTVKQAELLSLIRKKYEIPKVENLRLKDYPTINRVVDFILSRLPAGAPMKAAGPAAPGGPEPYVEVPVDESLYEATDIVRVGIRRTVVRWLPQAGSCPPSGLELREGETVLIHGSAPCREELGGLLSRMGLKAVDAERADLGDRTMKVRGIIFLEDRKFLAVPSLEDMPFHCELVVNEAVRRLEVLQAVLASGRFDDGKGFLAGVTFGGEMRGGSQAAEGSISSGALSGFIKSLAFEFPGCIVKAVNVDADAKGSETASALLDELLHDGGIREIGISGGSRWMLDLDAIEAPAAPGEQGRAPRRVILVTGAGGAVMRDVVRKIAAMAASDFVLLDIVKPEVAASGKWSKAFGGIMSLVEHVEKGGGSALYLAVDVTDAEAVAAAVRAALLKFGRIDAVIHGAGMERSRSVAKKQPDEFRRIAAIKIQGAGNLISSVLGICRPEKIIFFSSVAGRFGNAGQADYAAGNDFMARLAHACRGFYPGVDFLAVDWTAWDGDGMAGSQSIRAVLEEAGVEMLPRKEGLEMLWRLLAGRSGEAEVVVSGKLGMLEDSFYGAARREVLPPGPGPKDATSVGSGGFGRRLTLDPSTDLYLRDHAVDGIPVLPAVKGLELFHATCSSSIGRGWRLAGIQGAAFVRAVKFFAGGPREIFIRGAVRHSGRMLRCDCQLQTEDRSPLKSGSLLTHFGASMLYERVNGAAAAKQADVFLTRGDGIDMLGSMGDETTSIRGQDIYRYLFHGDQFRVTGSFSLSAGRDDCGIGHLKAAARPDLGGLYLLVEFGMQTAGLYLMRSAGIAALPSAIRSVQVLGEIDGGKPCRAVALFRGRSAGEGSQTLYSFDISIRDENGRSIAAIDDLRLVETGSVPDARAPARSLPQIFPGAPLIGAD